MKDPKKALWEQDDKTMVHVPTGQSQQRLKAMRAGGGSWEEDASTTVRPVNAPLPPDAYPGGIELDVRRAPPPPEVDGEDAAAGSTAESASVEPAPRKRSEPPRPDPPPQPVAALRRHRRGRRGRTTALRALAFVATAVVSLALGHALATHFAPNVAAPASAGSLGD